MTRPLKRPKGSAIAKIVFAAVPALVLWCGAGPALATHVGCADVIVEDTILDSDIRNCGNPGLVIAADNITLDLGGHTIEGIEYPPMIYTTGIDNRAGHDGVTIRNGRIENYDDAVNMDGADGNRLIDLSGSAIQAYRGQRNLFEGLAVSQIWLNEVSDSRLGDIGSSDWRTRVHLYRSDRNRVENGTLEYVSIGSSNGTQVIGNSVAGVDAGIGVSGSWDTRIQRNTVHGTIGTGGYDYSYGRNRIEDNVIEANGRMAISVWSAVDEVVRRNVVSGGDEGIFLVCKRCEVTRNRLSNNRSGITVHGEGNRLYRNKLTGHTRGIFLAGSRDGVVELNVITQGTPNSDRSGVLVTGTSSGNQIRANVLSGLAIGMALGASDNTIEHNRLDDVGTGIEFDAGARNVARWNSIRPHGLGFQVTQLDHGLIEENTVVGGLYGMYLGFSDGNLIARNRFVQNERFGVLVFEQADDNLIERNTVTRSGGDGIALVPRPQTRFRRAHGTVLRANRITRSQGDGILVDGFNAGTVLERNWTWRNANDGIDVEDPTATITGNLAYANRDLGIEAVKGVIDGGGNEAWRNGNRAQCLNVVC